MRQNQSPPRIEDADVLNETHEVDSLRRESQATTPRRNISNFVLVSLLASVVPASALVCLALATAELRQVGANINGILYATYTLSSIGGASTFVHRLGSKKSLVGGMTLYCAYIISFALAIVTCQSAWAYLGATVGGLGAGLYWTAQGVYFARSIAPDAQEDSAKLAGIFATSLLVEETVLDVLSTFSIRTWGWHWSVVFAVYAALAVAATLALHYTAHSFPNTTSQSSYCQQSTVALQLLMCDSKAKYFWGFHAAFGLSGAFLNSVVSANIVPVVLHDPNASYVGLLVAVHGGTAALVSWWAARRHYFSDGTLLCLGSLCLGAVAWPFLVWSDAASWSWTSLLSIYVLQGVGRATYEGTLKSILVQFFVNNSEAAFAMNVLMNGTSSALGWWLSGVFMAERGGVSPTLAWCVGLASLCGVAGYQRASQLRLLSVEVESTARNSESGEANEDEGSPVLSSMRHGGPPVYASLETDIM